MVKKVTMPKLSLSMAEGRIVRWLKREGEKVEAGEPILEIEADKVTTEIEAPCSGILVRILASEGSVVPVGETIAIIAEPGEEIPPIEAIKPEAPPKVEAKPAEVAPPPAEVLRVRVRATPLARKLAGELGVDLSTVRGTGPGGRIVKEDVLRATRMKAPPAVEVKPPEVVPTAPRFRAVPLTGMRKAIAEKMMKSLQLTAQLTLVLEADVTELYELYQKYLKAEQISITDLLVKATAKALREHSYMNSRIEGEQLILIEDINIGVATALEDGLIVPVVRNADKKSLKEISREVRELVERARSGRLSPEEVSGGTFTITNLGMFDIEIFTPIINYPESGILGVGKILENPVVVDGRIEVRRKINLSLTFDHKVTDGAQAARFLQTVKKFIENPIQCLL